MKKSPEKIILASASVLALALAYLGYSKISAINEDFAFSSRSSNKNDASVVGATVLDQVIATVAQPVLSPIATVSDKKRPVDLFVGVPLFARKPDTESESAKPIDPILDAPIHLPIPNTWWFENFLKHEMFFSDGPQRDSDSDGFSNLEEFEGKTDPRNVNDFPELADKLEFAKYESRPYFLWFSTSLGPQGYEFKITELPLAFEKANKDTQEKFLRDRPLQYARTDQPVVPNGNVFGNVTDAKWNVAVKSFQKDRFVLKEVVTKKVFIQRINDELEIEFATIEDKKANKMDAFEIPRNPIDRPATVRYDRSAVLMLNAAAEKGKTFTVEENTSFALPPTAKEKKYLLKTVSQNSITVEYKDKDEKPISREIKLNP
jgi:hypothetical protein